MTPIICTDYYKTEHYRQYPENTTMIYSNLTPRKSRLKGVDSVVFFGLQHFINKYLLGKFKTHFFDRPWKQVEDEYKYAIHTDTKHIKTLHDLGYLPLEIKAMAEGMRCPIRVPCMTIRNTLPEFYWLTNYLETLISCQLWQPMTSATIAAEYYKILAKYAKETTGSDAFVQWQGHDFSMRGMSSLESAILSGMGHLTSFTGTDTIPAIYALRESYGSKELIGASVPATEHSVMCMGTKNDEVGTFARLIRLYPTGILSVVSDTWDLWKVLVEYLPALKEEIMGRDGKLVIRPDSGDPVEIICGTSHREDWVDEIVEKGQALGAKRVQERQKGSPQEKGVIELLWDTFGGTIVKGGDGNEYKQLDSHVGAIYGDSITLDRARDICERLKAKGFSSTNIVFGIGSYTYQYNTRDTFGFAMKATYGEVQEMEEFLPAMGIDTLVPVAKGREIWKDPVTDDGTKKSARGLLYVGWDADKKEPYLLDRVTPEMETSYSNLLQTVFLDGVITRYHTLDEIRERIKQSL